jgi:hypothetical protein
MRQNSLLCLTSTDSRHSPPLLCSVNKQQRSGSSLPDLRVKRQWPVVPCRDNVTLNGHWKLRALLPTTRERPAEHVVRAREEREHLPGCCSRLCSQATVGLPTETNLLRETLLTYSLNLQNRFAFKSGMFAGRGEARGEGGGCSYATRVMCMMCVFVCGL